MRKPFEACRRPSCIPATNNAVIHITWLPHSIFMHERRDREEKPVAVSASR
jgi:hypothetical protein